MPLVSYALLMSQSESVTISKPKWIMQKRVALTTAGEVIGEAVGRAIRQYKIGVEKVNPIEVGGAG